MSKLKGVFDSKKSYIEHGRNLIIFECRKSDKLLRHGST